LEEHVALAQDFSMPTDVAEEGDDLDAHRASNPRGRQSEEGRLARMVRELHELEDEIGAKLTAAERLLVQLESRRVHEDGGYASRAEFEHRMMACTPVLRAMREAVPASPAISAKLSVAKRDPADARARQTKALTSIARALERFRGLDSEIHECATKARSTLCAIEGMRIFDECGYVSFEEFLERALGPSPILASVVALVATGPTSSVPDQTEDPPEPASARESLPSHGDDFGATSFGESSSPFEVPPSFTQSTDAEPAPEPTSATSEEGPETASSDAAKPSATARPARRHIGGIVVSVILCAAATIAGTAAGVWGGMAANAHPSGEPIADASVPTRPFSAAPAVESSRAAPLEPSAQAPKKGLAEKKP
jgi:hypothetical protein